MSDREPVLRDCFKVKKGLCVTGDTYITGNLTLSGDFGWMNPDALFTVGSIETTNLSAGKLYSSNDELVVVPFGPDYTILHPLSVVDETVFESAVQMETDLWVKGNLRVDGNAYLSAGVDGIINVGDTNTDNVVFNADIQSSLIPDASDTYDLGSVDQHWDTLYVHDISAHGSVDIEDNLFVSGTTTLSGALSAGSDATLSSNLTVSANTTIGGTTTLSGALSAGSDVEIDGILDVELDATLSNNLTVSANTTIGGNTTLSGTFSAGGDSKIDSDLHVVGDLRVDGDVWFNANNTNGTNTINLGDDNTDNVVFNADVDSNIIPDKTLTNTLGISSQQWLELFVQDISATGDVTISDTLNVSGNTNIVGDISATGIGVFDDDVHIKGDLRVDGNAYLSAGPSGSINIGDTNTDNIVFVADVSSNILPDESDKYDLGTSTQQWRELFVKDISATGAITSTETLTVSSDTIIGGTTTLSGTLSTVSDAKFDEDVHIVGDLRVDGDVWFNANNTNGTNTINLGDDSTDNVVFNADVSSGILPDDNAAFDLGSATQQWREVYSQDVSISQDLSSNRHVNFPNLSAGGLSGNFVSIQSDGELTTSTVTVDEIEQIGTVVNETSANWDSVYASVTATSANWDSVYASVTATSANWDSVYAYVNDTSATNNPEFNDTRFVNVTGDTMTGTLNIQDTLSATGNVTFDSDLHLQGDLRVDGDVWFNANNTNGTNTINLGDDNTDNVVFNADVNSNIIPDANDTHDLGTVNQHWNTLYVHDVSAHGSVSASDLYVTGLATLSSTSLSGDSTTPMLRVSQLGSGHAVEVVDQTDPDNSPFVIDATGKVGIGITTPGAKLDVDGVSRFTRSSTGGQPSIVTIENTATGTTSNPALEVIGDTSISQKLSSNSYVNFPNLSAGGLSGNFVSIQSDGELTTSTVSVDEVEQVATVVSNTSASWLNPVLHNMTRSSLQVTTPYGPTGELIDWTPTNSTVNVSGWWDASDESTLTIQNTNEVTQWADKSTENYDLSVLNSSATGPLTGRTLNGLRVLEWDNTNPTAVGTVMERAAFNWDQQNIEMNAYMVIHFDDEGALNDQDFLFEGSTTTSNRLFARVSGDGKIQVNGMTSVTGVISEGNTYVITLTINGNNSLIRVNGVQVASGTANNNPMVELNIGANTNQSQGLDGFIAEIVMTDDRSSTELIEGYLAHKWGLSSSLDSGHQYSQSTPQYTVQDYNPEFLAMQSDSSTQDSTYPDVNYTHAMVLPYDMTVRRVVMRGAATQGATVNVSVYSNRDETDPNTIEYKFFPLAPMETQAQTFTTNNEGRIFTFSDTSSANAGRTLGLSLSADRLIGHTNVTISVEYNV